MCCNSAVIVIQFLSTPSARRATVFSSRISHSQSISIHALREEGDPWKMYAYASNGNISIHALREEGDQLSAAYVASSVISIHALREEGDRQVWKHHLLRSQFLSTPSARRATCTIIASRWNSLRFLSTPSARRATQAVPAPHLRLQDFYPRPPRGGRPTPCALRRASCPISIHALREEGDLRADALELDLDKHFYPRPPRGGRLLGARI